MIRPPEADGPRRANPLSYPVLRASAGVTWAIGLVLLMLAIAWDLSGADMAMARWFGGPSGFALRDNALLSLGLHEGGRLASWLLVIWLVVSIWWPAGWMLRIPPDRRLQLVASALFAVLLVSLLKATSSTSCPWDLADFGRAARHVSHWAWSTADGGSGRCFPAGHASAGFAFVGGYFAFREREPGIACAWLLAALAAGLIFGLAQQARGAHFMSHTLWTAVVCWYAALAVDAARGAFYRGATHAR